ncbi:hypothetical protein MRB53_034398 [Persea americana]|uniref:Uncharacterized protein n=1 Tax=Persea americana TaxID=3435 RepID=A0ACC2K1F9_PERAE|nr:hypothetical protein MRB53_034398 [Persea americana]
MDEQRGIATIINDEIEATDDSPIEAQISAPSILLRVSPFQAKTTDRVAGDGKGGVVLGGEDVAGAPADLGPKGGEGFDEDDGLDGHVEGVRDSGALEGPRWAELGTAGHEARHLQLHELDLEARPKMKGRSPSLHTKGECFFKTLSKDKMKKGANRRRGHQGQEEDGNKDDTQILTASGDQTVNNLEVGPVELKGHEGEVTAVDWFGYVRGLGHGVAAPPSSLIGLHNNQRVKELTKRATTAERQAQELAEQLQRMESQMEAQRQQMEAQMKVQMAGQKQQMEAQMDDMRSW